MQPAVWNSNAINSGKQFDWEHTMSTNRAYQEKAGY